MTCRLFYYVIEETIQLTLPHNNTICQLTNYEVTSMTYMYWGSHDHMVVGFITTCAISTYMYHH
jgi:hypothetical protein